MLEPPVIVRPIHPSESRVIRRAKLMSIWTAIVGVLPDILRIGSHMIVDNPKFADWIGSFLPAGIRYFAMAVIIGYAQDQIRLRKTTTAPIAGTPSAEAATPAKTNS